MRTCVLPHIFFHESIVTETLLTDKSIARCGSVHWRLVLSEKCISKLIVPELARGREGLLRGNCTAGM